MSALAIPAFDPDSPDETILDAFEQVRRHRVTSYAKQAVEPVDWDAMQAADDAILAVEDQVTDNFPTTIEGVVAQLMLELTRECDRWIDEDLCRRGMRAVMAGKDKLDGEKRTLIEIADALRHLAWDRAFRDYRDAEAQLSAAAAVYSSIEAEAFRCRHEGSPASPLLDQAVSRAEAATEAASEVSRQAYDRLVRTLAPDWDALIEKTKATAEHTAADCQPWIIRDVQYLACLPMEAAHA